MDENRSEQERKKIVGSHELLHIIRACNRGDISLQEFLIQSKQWAEQIIEQGGSPEQPSQNSLADYCEFLPSHL